MCGIFGFVGKKEYSAETVLDGLKLLEYRGYDSWGIAVKKDKKISVDKHVGKIGDAKVDLPASTIGIGHTRWATHGGVTDLNAHPHLDCNKQLAVIHNGIVENYLEIKDELLKKGHSFVSETDTEVIPHLIEEHMKTMGFSSAVRKSFNMFKGLNAIVVLDAVSKEIIACKTGSPLVVGEGADRYFIASDATGIVGHTRKIFFLKDNEMVILGDTVQLIDLVTGKQLPIVFEQIDWEIEEATMGDYPHFMLKEMHEQAKIIAGIAQNYPEQIEKLAKVIQAAKGTFFIGAGTAFHACLSGVYLFSEISRVHVNTALASEFNYLEDFLTKDSLVIALSQSGETIDVIEPLNRAVKRGSKIVGVVNALGSTIYRMADYKLLLGAGPEKAVASTKAYIAKVSLLLLLAYAMEGKTQEAVSLLHAASREAKRLLEKESEDEIKKIAEFLEHKEHIYILGRGLSYPSAMEAALKIKEISYIHTEGLAGGELKHGTIALFTKGTPCIVFAPHDETYDAMMSNAMEVKARGGVIIGISPTNSTVFDHWIHVGDVGTASFIAQIIPMQLLAYQLAILKGYDPDKPRNLAKSVTVK